MYEEDRRSRMASSQKSQMPPPRGPPCSPMPSSQSPSPPITQQETTHQFHPHRMCEVNIYPLPLPAELVFINGLILVLFTRTCWQVPHNNSSLKQHPKPILVQDCAMCTSADQASCCAGGKTSSQPLLNCSNNGRTSFSTTPAAAIGLTRRGHGIGAGGSVKLHVGHRPVIKKRVTLR